MAGQPVGFFARGARHVEVALAALVRGEREGLAVGRPAQILLAGRAVRDLPRRGGGDRLVVLRADRGDEDVAGDDEGRELALGVDREVARAAAGVLLDRGLALPVGGHLDRQPRRLAAARPHRPEPVLELVRDDAAVTRRVRGAHGGALVGGQRAWRAADCLDEEVLAAVLTAGGEIDERVVVEPERLVVVAVEVAELREGAGRVLDEDVAARRAAVARAVPLRSAADECRALAVRREAQVVAENVLIGRRRAAAHRHRVGAGVAPEAQVAPRVEDHRLVVRAELARDIRGGRIGQTARRRAAIDRHDVDVVVALALRGEGEQPAVAGPDRVPVIGLVHGQTAGVAAGRGDDPQIALPREGDRRAVRRRGGLTSQAELGGADVGRREHQ